MMREPKTDPIPAPEPATPTVAAPAPMNLAAESMSDLIGVVDTDRDCIQEIRDGDKQRSFTGHLDRGETIESLPYHWNHSTGLS